MSTNAIGLNTASAERLAKGLNDLLANYQLFYMNARGFHWNIKGANFFELHVKFEELYTDLLTKIDEVAERIQTLGHEPIHSYSEYIKLASIEEKTKVRDGRVAIGHILEDFQALIGKQRSLLALASEAEDEGTAALMSDYIREQEKAVWMYRSYLGE
ncbi:Dps family protein [Saccharospirillum salsuginis]|uniref:DNA starvation/stationary phase protection protein n=1 Tax=Saccharospirillum salsuginis TaxID=418750 RepID=A0A918N6V4_9GAMM|nr:Dps family protein [Saccharospirillum salsuginis]GGX41149.1 DNA starvation/stationary phase protection protein [Saccharospirillum salsuginis]